jgi:hypothetical protein
MGRLKIVLPRVDSAFPEPVRQAIIRATQSPQETQAFRAVVMSI